MRLEPEVNEPQMKMLTTDHGLGKQLQELLRDALQVPETVRSFEVRFAVGEIVTVKCEYFATEPDEGFQAPALTLDGHPAGAERDQRMPL